MYVGVWEHVEEETNLWFPIELLQASFSGFQYYKLLCSYNHHPNIFSLKNGAPKFP